MFIEVCLGLITFMIAVIMSIMVMIVLVLKKNAGLVQESFKKVQSDLDKVAAEATQLSASLKDFVNSDLRKMTDETSSLIGQITDLTSDVSQKSRSLNFLFKPLSSLSSKMTSDDSDDYSPRSGAIPRVLKWLSTGLFLIKTTKELAKKL